MCGIFAAVSDRPVAGVLVQGLKRLEYRGYDSAGVATIDDDGMKRVCAVGKVAALESRVEAERLPGCKHSGREKPESRERNERNSFHRRHLRAHNTPK